MEQSEDSGDLGRCVPLWDAAIITYPVFDGVEEGTHGTVPFKAILLGVRELFITVCIEGDVTQGAKSRGPQAQAAQPDMS